MVSKSLVQWVFSVIAICTSLKSEAKISPYVQEQINSIPLEDQKIISEFFKGMLSQGDFAAVLFSIKPASMHDWPQWYIQRAPKNNSIRSRLLLMYNGWLAWQKYSSLFHLKKYKLFDAGYHNQMFTLWFVKEDHMNNVLNFYKEPRDGIKKHKKLGILLGYPKQDVEGFCEETKLGFLLHYFPFENDWNQVSEKLAITDFLNEYSQNFSKRLENMNENFQLRSFCKESEPFFPAAVYRYRSFSESDEDQEEWKQKIADLYNSENFLEEIITILVEP